MPSMSKGVEPCSRKGIFANNVEKLTLENVKVTGTAGAPITLQGVDQITEK